MICEDSIAIENIDFCPTNEVTPGVSEVGVYVCAVKDFATIAKPKGLDVGISYEEVATIAEAHTFAGDKGFHKVYINPDSGMVETAQIGEKGNMSFQNTFTGSLQGTGAKAAGWLRKHKNMPVIVIAKEKSGNTKQIGSELSPAYISEVTATSGSKPGDVKATTFKFMDTQNYPAPEYAGTITEFTPPV